MNFNSNIDKEFKEKSNEYVMEEKGNFDNFEISELTKKHLVKIGIKFLFPI